MSYRLGRGVWRPLRTAGLLAVLALNMLAPGAQGAGLNALGPVQHSDRHFGVAEAFRVQQTPLAWSGGVRWSRLTLSWPQLSPGYWNGEWYLPFPFLDTQISHDIDLVGMLINTPDQFSTDKSKGTSAVPTGLYLPYNDPNNSWGQFVRQTAKYYKGRIFHYVVWNEPDITPADANAAYYTWSGSVADYYQLLKVSYLAIKDVDPNLTVGTAGFTYWTDKKAGRKQYFDRLLDEVAKDPSAPSHNYYMDFVTLHLYNDPHTLYDVPILFHQLMQPHGFDKPIWINETDVIPYDDPVNAGTPSGTATNMRASLGEQASFVIQAFALGLAAGVERIEIYKMKDGDNDVLNGQALIGDVPDLRLRPAYLSYQVTTENMSNASSATYFKRGDVDEVVFDKGPQRVTVLWTNSLTPASVTIKSSGGTASMLDKFGQPKPLAAGPGGYQVSLDPATNTTNPDSPGKAMIGGNPVLLIEVGVTQPVGNTLQP